MKTPAEVELAYKHLVVKFHHPFNREHLIERKLFLQWWDALTPEQRAHFESTYAGMFNDLEQWKMSNDCEKCKRAVFGDQYFRLLEHGKVEHFLCDSPYQKPPEIQLKHEKMKDQVPPTESKY